MKYFLSINVTITCVRKIFKALIKLMCEIPKGIEMESVGLMELSSLAEDINVKTREASQNTDLDTDIDKTL